MAIVVAVAVFLGVIAAITGFIALFLIYGPIVFINTIVILAAGLVLLIAWQAALSAYDWWVGR